MSAEALNETLRTAHPAAYALLSPLGRRAALPMGIPQQTAQSAHCERQATIGQMTTGAGQPLTLPSLTRSFAGLDPKQAFLYAPQHGLKELRAVWQKRIGAPSLPIVTAGMSHGISIVCDLFTSPEHPLVVPSPYWDNYDIICTMRTGAEIRTFPFYNAEERFNVAGMAAVLAQLTGPATLLLNFPNNPTGYSPWADEVPGIVAAIHAHPHPLAVICDDAYNTLFFEEGLYAKSLFDVLSAGADPSRLLVCKVDGATKELVFFGGRVGFLSFSIQGAAADALLDKAAAVLRGTISSVSAPAQAAVLQALKSPTLEEEQAGVVAVLRERYLALRDALQAHGIHAWPFNSGCFASVPVKEDCEVLRQRLITEQSVGVIAVPSANVLRVAFCSIETEEIPDLVARLAKVIR